MFENHKKAFKTAFETLFVLVKVSLQKKIAIIYAKIQEYFFFDDFCLIRLVS